MNTWFVETDSTTRPEEKKEGKAAARGRRRALVRFAATLATLAFVIFLNPMTSPTVGHAALLGQESGEPKVTICHRPPGNPTKPEVIRVAQSDVTDHLAHGDPIGVNVLYVDASAEFPGSGQSESPFRRITDAVNLARCIRQAEGDYDSADSPLEIQVEAGAYVGAYTRNVLAKDETLEELPIILNVPNLILRGSTILELDDDGRPTREVDGSGTTITGAQPLSWSDNSDEVLFIITDTTDGMVGNQTTIEGFVLKSGNTPPANDGIGVVTLRVEDYAIRHNIFGEGFFIAIDSRAASGEISKNYMSNIGACAMCIQGPGTVDIVSNRALDGYGGLFLSPIVQHYPFKLGVQRRKLSVEPFEVPSVAHLDGAITNNDLSGHIIDPNFSFGLRLLMYGPGTASHVTEQSLSYIISDNTIQNNAFGVHIDAGFPERNTLPQTGNFVGTFSDNDVSGNCRTPMLVTFTRNTATLFPDDPDEGLSTFPYLQDSTYNITFTEGDEEVFEDRWIDHPIEDREDGRILNNVLLENGETIAPGTRIVPFNPENPGPCVID